MVEKTQGKYPSQFEKVKEITDKLEAGIKELMDSDKFKEYLKCLSRFHNYSLGNTILIALQKPDATLVAGYTAWKNQFGRQVQKGEQGIRILAPTPYKRKMEVDVIDPSTGQARMNPDGTKATELKEIMVPAFKVVNVFDVSQTDGRPIPSIGVNELTGDVRQYEMFFEALKRSCPVPISFEQIDSGAKGYYHTVDHRIALQEGMSQVQTIKTLIHEMTHQHLHSKDPKQYLYGNEDVGVLQSFEKARELFLAEAQRDNPLALYDLGRMAADGLGCEADAEEAYRWYEKALALFHSAEDEKPWKYTEYRIGKMYAAGLGTEQDYLQAADWFTLSADENYKYAQYSLGGLYYHGKGVEQDQETAFSLYTQSAAQGFPYASFELGKMLRDGIGCVKNQQDSDHCFKEAFLGFVSLEKKSHDDKLQYRLGWMLLNGIGTEKDEIRAKEYFGQAASVGNPFACYQLAKLILAGENVPPQEVEKALGYLNKAVEAENPYAAYFLGKLYEKGQHLPQNTDEAIRLYTLSAEQDNDFAAYRLGKLYLGGGGVLKDVESAVRWLTFAADRKNQFAEYALGNLYLKGEAIPQDISKALEYLKCSANQGNQFAQYRLGKLYLMGEDVAKDIQTALQFLIAAAEQDNQYAQYTLGKLYLMGKDVPRNKDAAVRWFTLSAAQGNMYAQFFLDHMEDFREPSALLVGTRLLHHMSRIFSDNAPPLKPSGQQTDRKLLRKLREKKRAHGHARDDHEQNMSL